MHEMIDELYELCETVEADLKKTNEKLRKAGGELSGSDLEYVDKLTHTLKSIKTTMAMIEADEDGYSERGGSSREGGSYRGGGSRGSSYRGGSSRRGGSSYQGGGYQGGGSSYAQRRNSMGQFTREGGSSRDSGEFREMLEEAMDSAPNEQIRMQLERLMNQM